MTAPPCAAVRRRALPRGVRRSICDELVDDMITVTPDEICASVQDGFEDTRAMLEPAGAIAIAGLKKWAKHAGVSGETLVAVTSGANLTFNRLRMIAERALIGQRTEALLAVRMPDRPGAMLKLYGAIAPRNVTEMLYRSSMSESNSEATIFLSIEVNEQGAAAAGEVDRMDEEVAEIVKGLAVEGIRADDMSENELAKSHMRYLAGGTKVRARALLGRAAGRSARTQSRCQAARRSRTRLPACRARARTRVAAQGGRDALSLRVPGAAGRAQQVPHHVRVRRRAQLRRRPPPCSRALTHGSAARRPSRAPAHAGSTITRVERAGT